MRCHVWVYTFQTVMVLSRLYLVFILFFLFCS
jgi:hypothetical protein